VPSAVTISDARCTSPLARGSGAGAAGGAGAGGLGAGCALAWWSGCMQSAPTAIHFHRATVLIVGNAKLARDPRKHGAQSRA
jgi:hypothetical protein